MAEDYGLANVNDSLKKQNDLLLKRQAEEQAQKTRENIANQEKQRIAESSSRISQDLVGNLSGLMGTIDKAEKGKAEVDALKASGNPLDMLDLIGKQITNPEVYTRKGRAAAVAESTQLINARTQAASIQQAALSDLSQVVDASLKSAGGALETAKLNELQNQEQIQSEMLRVQTQTQTLQNSRALAEQKLATMSEEETRVAYQKSEGKPLNIGGVMISPGDLENRMIMMDARKDAREARTAATELKNMNLAERMAQRELETMSIEELRPMLLNGSKDFKGEWIQQVYDRKMKAQSEQLSRLGKEFQYQDFSARVTVPAMEDAERMTPAIPKNTPLAAALDAHKNTVGTVMGMTKQFTDQGLPVPLEVNSAASVAITESRKELDTAIAKEAKLKANGNKELEEIYSEVYRGNPAPRDKVEQYVADRLDKNENLTAVLPEEVANSVRSRFNEIYSAKMKTGSMMPGFDKKQARAEAIQEAIAEGVGAKITERTQDLFQQQVMQPTNPLYGAVNPNQFLGMVAKADREGIAEFKSKYGLTDEEFARFTAGQRIEGKVGPENLTDLGIVQTQALYMQLDGIEAGLSKKYADWWAKQGNTFISQMAAGRAAMAQKDGIQAMTMETFAGPMEQRQTAAQMQVIADATESYDQRKAVRYNEMVSFDLNPGHRQAALLQFNKELNDAEKKQFMKGFILPIIRTGQEKNMSYEQINVAIESAIDAGQVEDPGLQKILKKVAKERTSQIEHLESVVSQPFWRAAPDQPRMGFQPQAWGRRTTATRAYEWYRESLEGK